MTDLNSQTDTGDAGRRIAATIPAPNPVTQAPGALGSATASGGSGTNAGSASTGPSNTGSAARGPRINSTPLSELAHEAKNIASGVAEQAKGVGAELVTHAQGIATQRQTKSADDLRDAATALREASRQLNDNIVAPFIGKAADQIESASGFLRGADAMAVQAAVVSFAKREPLLFLGGAFALGIVAARFLKSGPEASQGGDHKPTVRS